MIRMEILGDLDWGERKNAWILLGCVLLFCVYIYVCIDLYTYTWNFSAKIEKISKLYPYTISLMECQFKELS